MYDANSDKSSLYNLFKLCSAMALARILKRTSRQTASCLNFSFLKKKTIWGFSAVILVGGGGLAFDPEPSSTILVFWAEHLFSTHPPSEASAPPEHRTALSSHTEFRQAPCPSLRTYGTDGTDGRNSLQNTHDQNYWCPLLLPRPQF